jgi:hypothetical protein
VRGFDAIVDVVVLLHNDNCFLGQWQVPWQGAFPFHSVLVEVGDLELITTMVLNDAVVD